MNWRDWLIRYCPVEWTNGMAHQYIIVECPNVTLTQVKQIRPDNYLMN